MALRACTCSMLRPRSRAVRTEKMRSGVGVRRLESRSASLGLGSARSAPQPAWPVSKERKAFWNDSSKQRPIAMASPTDFIDVVSTDELPLNFSKAKRGTLVTT